MSEIQIILPLSMFEGVHDFTPQSIVEHLQASTELLDDYVQLTNSYNSLVRTMNSTGKSLELILDEVDDSYEKAKALRKLASELKEMKMLERMV